MALQKVSMKSRSFSITHTWA